MIINKFVTLRKICETIIKYIPENTKKNYTIIIKNIIKFIDDLDYYSINKYSYCDIKLELIAAVYELAAELTSQTPFEIVSNYFGRVEHDKKYSPINIEIISIFIDSRVIIKEKIYSLSM